MVVKVKNTPEHYYAIAEIVRSFTPLALTAAGAGVAIYVITATNLSSEKFAIAIGVASSALTGACGTYNPQSKERRQEQTRVGHIDRVDIEQTVEENESENRGDRL
jgi:hypothetical protein